MRLETHPVQDTQKLSDWEPAPAMVAATGWGMVTATVERTATGWGMVTPTVKGTVMAMPKAKAKGTVKEQRAVTARETPQELAMETPPGMAAPAPFAEMETKPA
jgi:hypothetical protein